MTDEQAVQLLDLLCTYFEDYGELAEPRAPDPNGLTPERPVKDFQLRDELVEVLLDYLAAIELELSGDLLDSLSVGEVPLPLRKRLEATRLTADALVALDPYSRKVTP